MGRARSRQLGARGAVGCARRGGQAHGHVLNMPDTERVLPASPTAHAGRVALRLPGGVGQPSSPVAGGGADTCGLGVPTPAPAGRVFLRGRCVRGCRRCWRRWRTGWGHTVQADVPRAWLQRLFRLHPPSTVRPAWRSGPRPLTSLSPRSGKPRGRRTHLASGGRREVTGVWRVAFLGVAEGGHLSPGPAEPSVSRKHLEGPNFPVTMPVNKLTEGGARV